jgi:hypothetical protein
MDKTVALETAKINEEYAKEALANNIATNKRLLAAEEAKLEALEAGYSGMSTTEKQAKVQELGQELAMLSAQFSTSDEVKGLMLAGAQYESFKDVVDGIEDAMNEANAFVSGESGWTIGNVFEIANDRNVEATVQPDNSRIRFAEYNYLNYYPGIGYDYTTTSLPVAVQGLNKYRINEYNKLKADRFFEDAVEPAKTTLENVLDVLGTPDDTVDTKQKDGTTPTLYAVLAQKKIDYDAEVAKADDDPTKDVETAKANLRIAENNIAVQEDAIATTWEPAYVSTIENWAKYKELMADVDLVAAATAVVSLEEACDVFNFAAEDVYALKVEMDNLNDVINAINGTSAYDIEGQVAQVKENIAFYKDQIASDEQMIDPVSGYTYEQLVQQAEADLAIAQSNLVVREAEAEIAKKALEEAIGDFIDDETGPLDDDDDDDAVGPVDGDDSIDPVDGGEG